MRGEQMTKTEPNRYLNPTQVVNELLKKYIRARVEYFGFIAFDAACHVIKVKELFKGGISTCAFDRKTLYWSMLRYPLSGVIFFHNHPSGNTTPSEADVHMCRSLEQGCEVLGINLLDNLIVSRYGYTSFREVDLITKKEKTNEVNICV